MSTFVYGGFGAADAFDALCYGETHPNTVQFLAAQVSNVADTLNTAGRAFLGKTQELFEHYNGSEAMRFARGVLAKVKGVFQTQRVQQLDTLEELQDASVLMQRWLMANPAMRSLYHAQKCDGYSDTYVDMEPGMVGEEHYDYRRVMDGQFIFNPDEETDWKCVQYLDRLKEGDRDLSHDEQVDILRTWDRMDLLTALGKDDPTSAVGGSL